jgi:hemolysin D
LKNFLPALLEIEQRPPAPAGRAVLWVLLALLLGIAAGAWWGRIDVVVVATGTLSPVAGVHPVQPAESGVVRALLVNNGARVVAGAPLLELDPTLGEADLAQVERDLERADEAVAALRVVLQGAVAGPSGSGRARASPGTQTRLLADQAAEHTARLAALGRERDAQLSAQLAHQRQMARLQRTLPLVREESQALEALLERGLQARSTWLRVERERIELQETLSAERHRGDVLVARLQRLDADREALEAGFRRGLRERLLIAETDSDRLQQIRRKALRLRTWLTVRAPVGGIVHRLAVKGVGGVLEAGEPIAVIVPEDAPLEAETWLPQADAGRVKVGQAVAVKVDAFPFTDHGTLRGEILHLGAGAVEHPSLGPVYPLRIRLAPSPHRLRPGMGVRGEIHLGTRRLADYLLEPLLVAGQEAFREP